MARPIKITILGDAKQLNATLAATQTKLGGFSGFIGKAAKTSGVAFAALGVTGIVAAGKLDDAYDTIRIGTGATGEDLEALEDVFRNVAKTVPESFGDVATAVADLNTRTGLTGGALEALAGQMLDLSRITGTDVAANVKNITRVFGDWDIATSDQAETMDKLFRASQTTGIGLDQLNTSVVNFGAPLRSLGFSFDDSIALLAKFEKEGVNTEAVLAGMKIGLGKMAAAGEEPAETLARLREEIKGAATDGEAMAIAVEAFGTRAGPDMAAAIREGRFEIEELSEAIANGENTIADTADETEKWKDKLKILMNKTMIKLAPLLEKVTEALESMFIWIEKNSTVVAIFAGVIGGLMAATIAYKAVMAITTLATKAWSIAQAALNLVMSLNPVMIVVLAIAALVAGIIIAYKNSETFRDIVQQVWDKLKGFGEFMVDVFGPIFETVFAVIKEQFGLVLDQFKEVVDFFKNIIKGDFKAAFGNLLTIVKTQFKLMFNWFIKLPLKLLAQLVPIGKAALKLGKEMALKLLKPLADVIVWYVTLPLRIGEKLIAIGKAAFKIGVEMKAKIINKLADIIGWFKDLPGKIKGFVASIATAALDFGKAIVDGIKQGISDAWGAMVDWFKGKVTGMWSSAKGWIGMGSPSKLYATMGVSIAQGLGQGIVKSFPSMVEKPMEDMVKRFQKSSEASVGKLVKGIQRKIDQSIVVRRAVAGDNALAQAKLDVVEANREMRQATRALAKAKKNIAKAKEAGDGQALKEAKRERKAAIDAKAEATAAQIIAARGVQEAQAEIASSAADAERLAAEVQVQNTKDAAETQKRIEDSQRNLEIARARAAGDDIRVSELQLAGQQSDLVFASRSGAGTAALTDALAAIVSAQSQLRDTTARGNADGAVHVHFDGPPPATAAEIGAAVVFKMRVSGHG